MRYYLGQTLLTIVCMLAGSAKGLSWMQGGSGLYSPPTTPKPKPTPPPPPKPSKAPFGFERRYETEMRMESKSVDRKLEHIMHRQEDRRRNSEDQIRELHEYNQHHRDKGVERSFGQASIDRNEENSRSGRKFEVGHGHNHHEKNNNQHDSQQRKHGDDEQSSKPGRGHHEISQNPVNKKKSLDKHSEHDQSKKENKNSRPNRVVSEENQREKHNKNDNDEHNDPHGNREYQQNRHNHRNRYEAQHEETFIDSHQNKKTRHEEQPRTSIVTSSGPWEQPASEQTSSTDTNRRREGSNEEIKMQQLDKAKPSSGDGKQKKKNQRNANSKAGTANAKEEAKASSPSEASDAKVPDSKLDEFRRHKPSGKKNLLRHIDLFDLLLLDDEDYTDILLDKLLHEYPSDEWLHG